MVMIRICFFITYSIVIFLYSSWKLTFTYNRYTHNAKANYAPIEGEALAVAWTLEKARHFVLGCKDLIVATDHKPLLKILGDRHLQDIKNPCLVNLKQKTLPFKFKIIHVPGSHHFTADGVTLPFRKHQSRPDVLT